MSQTLAIACPGGFSAEIATQGAELRALADESGQALLWDGDPAFWSGRAPVLFPIIGALAGERFRHRGASYALPRHGFARRRTWRVVTHEPARAVVRLEADDATRAVYPFDFALEMAFAVSTAGIAVTATVDNRGGEPMPFSLGFHPALRWPFDGQAGRAGHEVWFAGEEAGPVSRLDAAGLVAREEPSPIAGRRLALEDALFVDDAMVLRGLASRSVAFGRQGGRRLCVRFPDFPDLGLWTKPGAGFLCIEPWQGHADPAGFAGELSDKPGVVCLAPGAFWQGRMEIGWA